MTSTLTLNTVSESRPSTGSSTVAAVRYGGRALWAGFAANLTFRGVVACVTEGLGTASGVPGFEDFGVVDLDIVDVNSDWDVVGRVCGGDDTDTAVVARVEGIDG